MLAGAVSIGAPRRVIILGIVGSLDRGVLGAAIAIGVCIDEKPLGTCKSPQLLCFSCTVRIFTAPVTLSVHLHTFNHISVALAPDTQHGSEPAFV